MRTVDEHLATVLDGVGSMEPIEVTLLDAQGLLLAEDVTAAYPLPGFDCAGRDGYAVRAVDTRDATADEPASLQVVGDIAAGAKTRSGMGPGLAMRIMTGAPLPAGADAVVKLGDTDRGLAKVGVLRPATSGDGVRKLGEDLTTGSPALGAGAALGPQQIALLAALNRNKVIVRPRPRVTILSTGSELIEVGGHRPAFGEVIDSNSYMLSAAAKDAGADARRIGIVPDDHAALLDALENQLLRADVLITTGGVSEGAFDVVKEALAEIGTVEFADVAMHPGMAQGFGHLGDKVPVFCLPGNPVSSLVAFEAFVRPAIRKLLGKRSLQRASVEAVALDGAESPRGIRQYRRGVLHREAGGGYSVSFMGGTQPHLIASLALSNCLVVIEEDATSVEAGSEVTVIPLLLANR